MNRAAARVDPEIMRKLRDSVRAAANARRGWGMLAGDTDILALCDAVDPLLAELESLARDLDEAWLADVPATTDEEHRAHCRAAYWRFIHAFRAWHPDATPESFVAWMQSEFTH